MSKECDFIDTYQKYADAINILRFPYAAAQVLESRYSGDRLLQRIKTAK
jgi:hypothetical protein